MADTIASIDDIRHAGNISSRVEDEILNFYLDISSILFSEMVGSTVYLEAIGDPPTLTAIALKKLKISEALMTVGLILPCLSMQPEERGILSVISQGAAGQLEKWSFVKEIDALAATFINLAYQISGEFITAEGYETVWSEVIMRMFPSLDEMPTVAPIHSDEEILIKIRRGDEVVTPSQM
jgi:hypothetical protein